MPYSLVKQSEIRESSAELFSESCSKCDKHRLKSHFSEENQLTITQEASVFLRVHQN